jgi:hypothetical protein
MSSQEGDVYTEAAAMDGPLTQVIVYGIPTARAIHETDFVRVPGEWPQEAWDDPELHIIQVLTVSISNHPGP